MIGNVMVAYDNNQLNYLVNERLKYKLNYANQKKQMGVKYEIPKCKVLLVDDYNPEQEDYVPASILLPNGNTMSYLIAGDEVDFRYLYTQKLNMDSEVKDYLAVIVAGLMEYNIDYILYFDCASNIYMQEISNVLLSFLNNMLGIVVYNAMQFQQDNSVCIQQSMLPHYVANNKLAIDGMGYSKNKPTVFQQF